MGLPALLLVEGFVDEQPNAPSRRPKVAWPLEGLQLQAAAVAGWPRFALESTEEAQSPVGRALPFAVNEGQIMTGANRSCRPAK